MGQEELVDFCAGQKCCDAQCADDGGQGDPFDGIDVRIGLGQADKFDRGDEQCCSQPSGGGCIGGIEHWAVPGKKK